VKARGREEVCSGLWRPLRRTTQLIEYKKLLTIITVSHYAFDSLKDSRQAFFVPIRQWCNARLRSSLADGWVGGDLAEDVDGNPTKVHDSAEYDESCKPFWHSMRSFHDTPSYFMRLTLAAK
jgi:hypothetical protein